MAYQLYRNTTLGNTLQETLDELIQVTTADSYAFLMKIFGYLFSDSPNSLRYFMMVYCL